MNLVDIRFLCVSPFPLSTTRENVMKGLETVVSKLTSVGTQGDLWVNGSFLTEKINPHDVDIVLRILPDYFHQCGGSQMQMLAWLGGDEPLQTHLCDSYLFVDYPEGHPNHADGEWMHSYWIRQFGFSREDALKGIAVISLS